MHESSLTGLIWARGYRISDELGQALFFVANSVQPIRCSAHIAAMLGPSMQKRAGREGHECRTLSIQSLIQPFRQVYALSKAEGARDKPFSNSYRPHFFLMIYMFLTKNIDQGLIAPCRQTANGCLRKPPRLGGHRSNAR